MLAYHFERILSRKKRASEVQIRHSGGGERRSIVAWPLGEKAEHHPTKREPPGYGIILIGFRNGDSNRKVEPMKSSGRESFSWLSGWTAFYTSGAAE